MDKRRPTLNELFRQTRVRPRLVKEDDVRNIMSQSDMAGNGMQKSDSVRSRFRRGGVLIATALFIGLAVSQLTVKSDQTAMPLVKSHDSASYRVEVIRDPESGDSVVILIPPANADINQEKELAPTGPASIDGIHVFTLTSSELAAIGVRTDSLGALLYSYNERGSITETGVGILGTSFRPFPPKEDLQGVTPLHSFPVFITDDVGRYRVYSYDEDDIDSSLAARRKQLSPRSPEYYQLSMEIGRRAERTLFQRFNRLVPIIIRSGRTYTAADSAAKRWRPDVILWYDPTPEFLAALPERMRRELAPELSPAGQGDAIAEVGRRENGRRRDREEQRDAAIVQPAARDTSLSRVNTPMVDSIRRDATEPAGDDAVTGGPYLDASRTADGAIISSMLFPNPTHRETTLLLRLNAPRALTITLHDLYGRKLREIMQFEMTSPGERGVSIDLGGIREGIYLISVMTEKGERVVQRVVLAR